MAAAGGVELRSRRGFDNPGAAGWSTTPATQHAASAYGGGYGDTSYGGSTYSGGSNGYGGSFNSGSTSARRNDNGDKDGGILNMPKDLQLTLVLLILTAAFLHADQNLAAPNLSAIAADFDMTPMQKDSRLGGMVQFGFFLIGGSVSLVVGPAADQFDRITVLTGVVLCGCIPTLLMSLMVPSSKAGFFYFLLARVCTGVAIGGSFPVLFSLSADIFPASQRATIVGAIGSAGQIGAALGALMAGLVGPKYGWRMPFTCVSVPALVIIILVRLFLQDPRTVKKAKAAREEITNHSYSAWAGGVDVVPDGHMSIEDLDLSKFQKVLAVPSNMLVFMQALPGCVPISVIVTFLADYLATEQGMAVQASTAITAVFGASCMVFGLTGGMVGESLYGKRKDQFCMLICASMVLAAIPFMTLVHSPQAIITTESGRPTFFAFFLAMCGGCAATAGPNIRLILMNINPSERRGTVFSAFTLCDDLGKGLGPTVVVTLVSIFGRRLAFTMAFAGWWVSAAIMTSLRGSLVSDAMRGGDSILPTKKL